MNLWPDGAVTRDVVEGELAASRWRVEWCEGSGVAPVSGEGATLPAGVLERVPTRAKRRKLERGLGGGTTWMFPHVREHEGVTVIEFREGPS